MAQEQIQESYYSAVGNKWIDIHQSVKTCIEVWLSKLLFQGDLSRVIYSVPDITFRRRIELLDKGKTENDELTPISLNLPYASYYQSTDWVDDDRGSTQQAAQALIGEYDQNTYHRVRSLACKSTYKIQAFFSRRDDVRVAQQLIRWEQSPKGPIKLYSIITWRGKQLAVPAFLTIENINTTPEWKDLDFLTKQRIFPIEIECTVRSYQVLLNNINNYISLPIRFGSDYADTWDENSTMYLTEETVLDWALSKFDLDGNVDNVDLDSDDVSANAKKYFNNKEYTTAELKTMCETVPSEYTEDILAGYYSDSTEVSLSSYKYDEATSTTTTAIIKYKVKSSDYKYFSKIEFLVPGRNPLVITDCKETSASLTGLYPNSTYNIKILTYGLNGTITTYNYSFTTKADSTDTTPTPKKINAKIPGLAGINLKGMKI
jgi:hypothetical protein